MFCLLGSLAGFEQGSSGLEQASAGFKQGSANYLGSNRILRGSWPHGPPPSSRFITKNVCTRFSNIRRHIPPNIVIKLKTTFIPYLTVLSSATVEVR